MGDMTELAPSLVELARRFGIATEYTDWTGRQVLVSEATLVAALAALGVPAQTEQQRNDALAAQLRSYWARPLPATIVMRAGEQTQFRVHVTDGAPADVWLQLEDGTTRAEVVQVDNFTPPFDLDGRWIGEASFVLPADLPLGYHRVNLRSGDSQASAAVVVTPDWLGLPDKLAGRRAWGLAVQLYSVRSRQSWGIGDLTDLANLALWSASAHGAGYVLVNPLHAATLPGPAGRSKPIEPSPYLPTSRRFVNPLYLRVEAIPELVDLPKRGRVQRLRTNVQQHADQLDTIDRDSAWAAKRAALKLVHRVPRSAGRELAYAASVPARAAPSTTSPPGARWPRRTAMIGIDGRNRCGIPMPQVSPISSTNTPMPSISTAGCSGSWTSSSPVRSRRRSGPACRWASWQTSPLACTPTGPTPGLCRTCWPKV